MRLYYLFPAIPALALMLMPFLPFVNTAHRWFGFPPMLVWGAVWCVLLTPSFLLAERLMSRRGEGDDQ